MIRAAQLWSCRDLGALVNTFGPVAMEQGLSGPTNVARCLARTVGRSPALEQIRARTHALVDHVIASAGSEWDFTLRLLEPDYDALDQRARDSLHAHAAELVAQATLAVLSVEAIADIADESLLLAARGPWLAGLNPSVTLPGPEWSAGPRVRRRVRRILRPLDLAAWSRINALHNHARDLESDYDHLCWRLTARFLTSATGCPWSRLSDLPAARELRQVIGRGRPYEGLVEWASCLAALMSDRARYSHADIEVFAAAVRDVLPQTERELNRIQ
jgi:hypothetical protein